MRSLKKLFFIVFGIVVSSTVLASTAVEQLLSEYQAQGASQFSAESGKTFWNQKFYSSSANQQRSCATCHTTNVKQYGKHATTGKEIKPLAPSVMSKRLTNPKKIRKWFRRNCNWTLGRECTPQEKGNVLMYLKDQ
ncbi:MAG: DUF1924 domain-containing protein [Gammaproteobacteria bacterium]|jgi:hypothetical protein